MPTNFNMSDVMISYSRKDKAFVQRLNQSLKDSGREVWVDWDDIPPTVDWWSEIQAGIDAANTIVFIISPDSIRSGPCLREIEHASTNNKRIVPVLHRPLTEQVDEERMHPALKIHNWIYFRAEDDYNEGFRKLVHALETDFDHTQKHTRYLVLAQEWDTNNRKNSLLLRGDELGKAEVWLTGSINSNPPPTALQAEYITASRKAAIRFRQTVAGAMAAAMVALALLALFAFNQSVVAKNNIETAEIAGQQADIAIQALHTQQAIANENQTVAAAVGTVAVNNQMTADAAGTLGADIESTANAAATAASNAQATSGTEAANLILTSNAAATSAADSNQQALDAQASADANAATANAAGTAAADAQKAAADAKKAADDAAAREAAAKAEAAKAAMTATAVQTQVAAQQERTLSLSLAAAARRALAAGDRPLAMHLALLAVNRPDLKLPTELSVEQVFYEIAYSFGLRRTLSDSTALVTAVAYNPKNINQVALGLNSGNIELKDLLTSKIIVLKGHSKKINGIAYSPDGNYLVSVSDDYSLKSWDAKTGQNLSSWTQPSRMGILSVAFSSSGNFIASASNVDADEVQRLENLHLFDFSEGKIATPPRWSRRTRANPNSDTSDRVSATSVAFSPDENILAVGLYGSVQLWDRSGDREKVVIWNNIDVINSVAFSPDGQFLIAGSNDNTMHIWDVPGKKVVMKDGIPWVWRGHSDNVLSAVFSPDGNYVVSGSSDSTLRLWDAKTGRTIGSPWTGHTSGVFGVSFSPDGNKVISTSFDFTARLWDTTIAQANGNPWRGHTDSVNSVAFSPDGSYVVSGSTDQTLRLWDPTKGLPIGISWVQHTYPQFSKPDMINSVTFSLDGNFVVSGSGGFYGSIDKTTLRFWNRSTGETTRNVWDEYATVNSVAFSPKDACLIPDLSPKTTSHLGTCVASGSQDSTLRLWDGVTGALIKTINTIASVRSVAFSPKDKCTIANISGATHQGTCLAVGLQNGELWLIDLITGNRVGNIWNSGTGAILSVVFSPDGQFVALGSSDHTMQIWNAVKGVSISKIVHPAIVNSVAFSPDSLLVVSGAVDGNLRLWDAASGQQIGDPWFGHTDSISSVAFSPDGNYVVSGSSDTTLRLWTVRDLPQLITWVCSEQHRYARYLSDVELARNGISRDVDTGLAGKCGAVEKNSASTSQSIQAFSAESAPVPEITPEITPEVTAEFTPEVTPEVTPEITPETTPDIVSWIPSGAWTVTENGWSIMAGDGINLLTSDRAFDLSQMSAPQLQFSSLINSSSSLATVQISIDGSNWNLLSTLAASVDPTDEVIDLSAYGGQSVWLQFAWFYSPSEGAAPESWNIAGITVGDVPVLPTLTPETTANPETTETPILETTENPEMTETATLGPSLIPSLTLSPDVPTPVEPSLTPDTSVATAAPTNTPSALMLPVFASMDDGAPGWSSSGGWILSDAARFGEGGLGWFVSGDGVQNTLTWGQPLDLRQATMPQLHFQTLLQKNASLAVVNISTDNIIWQPVAQIMPAASWTEIIVDLTPYRGQIIWLQFLWLYGAPAADQPAEYWMLDNVQVMDVPITATATASLTPDLATPSPSASPTLEPSLTPSPTLTDTLVPSETPSPTIESTATATATLTDTETPVANTDTPVPIATLEEIPG